METQTFIKKTKLNFIIDAVLLLDFSAILGVGLMIKYVLLTGGQKRELFGVNFEQTFLGLNRHGWGNIHLYLGFAFVALLFLHFIFHWNMIAAMLKNFFQNISIKKALAVIFLSFCLLLIIMPLFIQPINGQIESKHQNNGNHEFSVNENSSQSIHDNLKSINEFNNKEHRNRELNIRGYMTIDEVCRSHGVSSKHLKTKIGIPAETPDNTPLSTLRKQYGIKMSKISDVLFEYSNKHKNE